MRLNETDYSSCLVREALEAMIPVGMALGLIIKSAELLHSLPPHSSQDLALVLSEVFLLQGLKRRRLLRYNTKINDENLLVENTLQTAAPQLTKDFEDTATIYNP